MGDSRYMATFLRSAEAVFVGSANTGAPGYDATATTSPIFTAYSRRVMSSAPRSTIRFRYDIATISASSRSREQTFFIRQPPEIWRRNASNRASGSAKCSKPGAASSRRPPRGLPRSAMLLTQDHATLVAYYMAMERDSHYFKLFWHLLSRASRHERSASSVSSICCCLRHHHHRPRFSTSAWPISKAFFITTLQYARIICMASSCARCLRRRSPVLDRRFYQASSSAKISQPCRVERRRIFFISYFHIYAH